MKRKLSPQLKITGIYVLVALLWIYFSDSIVLQFVDDLKSITYYQTIKGSMFVLVTGGLLFALVRKYFYQIVASKKALLESYEATLEGWVRALDLFHDETKNHTQRVAGLTVFLAKKLGISGDELEHIRRGAILHDIGKIGIPDQVLKKPATLDQLEWEIIRKHPTMGYELLKPIQYLRPALDIPYCHHERWDGTGYPQGLKEDEIPMSARIFTVVDVWDALSFDRAYKKGWPQRKVLAYIKCQAKRHFDPSVVKFFLKEIENFNPDADIVWPVVAAE